MSWLLLATQLMLSAVLLLAATGKVLRSEEFAGALRLSHLPSGLVAPLSVVLPALEFGLAIALLLSDSGLLPAIHGATLVLLGAFTAWMVWVQARRLRVSCGCFGTGGVEIGERTIARNLLLLLVALGGLLLAVRTPSPLPEPSVWLTVTVTSVGMCMALLAGLWAGLPSLVLSLEQMHRLESPGSDS